MRNLTILFILPLLSLCPRNTFADNWDLFPFNQSSYYSDDGTTSFNHLYHYVQDSILISGNLQVYYFNRYPCSFSQDPCIYQKVKEFGDSVKMESYSKMDDNYFYASETDTAFFYHKAHLNDTWFISTSGSNYSFDSIRITCSVEGEALLWGVNDSIKKFLIEAWDNGAETSFFDGYEFELSKKFGFIKWKDLNILLEDGNYKDYTLMGVVTNNIKYGDPLPTFNDYFQNYLAGNIFYWYNSFYSTGTDLIRQSRDSIISAFHTIDSIEVIWERNLATKTWDAPDSNYSYWLFADTTIYYREDFESVFGKTFSQMAFYEYGTSPYATDIKLIYNPTFQLDELKTDNIDNPSAMIDSCLNYMYSFYLFGKKTDCSYMAGLGMVSYNINTPYSSEWQTLTGCSISGVIIGDPQWVPESIFPDNILNNGSDLPLGLLSNITSGSLMLNPSLPSGSLFSIFDVSGKLLKQGTVSLQEINVVEFTIGFYLIKIEWNGAEKVSRFFKH